MHGMVTVQVGKEGPRRVKPEESNYLARYVGGGGSQAKACRPLTKQLIAPSYVSRINSSSGYNWRREVFNLLFSITYPCTSSTTSWWVRFRPR